MPQIVDINVVFPAPFGPNKAKISPLFISKLTLSKALNPEAYVLLKFFIDYYDEFPVNKKEFCEIKGAVFNYYYFFNLFSFN